MEKTIRFALFLMITSGLLFTACASDDDMDDDLYEEDEMEEYEESDDDEEDEDDDDEEGPSVRPGAEEESAVEETVPVESVDEEVEEAPAEEEADATTYVDGNYTASLPYSSPGGEDSLTVTLTIEGDKVTAVSTTAEASNSDSEQYQSRFHDGIGGEVNGVLLDAVDVSAVNGASLTSGAFNRAVAQIKADAAR